MGQWMRTRYVGRDRTWGQDPLASDWVQATCAHTQPNTIFPGGAGNVRCGPFWFRQGAAAAMKLDDAVRTQHAKERADAAPIRDARAKSAAEKNTATPPTSAKAPSGTSHAKAAPVQNNRAFLSRTPAPSGTARKSARRDARQSSPA